MHNGGYLRGGFRPAQSLSVIRLRTSRATCRIFAALDRPLASRLRALISQICARCRSGWWVSASRSRPSRGCGPHRPGVALIEVQMPGMAEAADRRPRLWRISRSAVTGCHWLAISRSGSPAATPIAISSRFVSDRYRRSPGRVRSPSPPACREPHVRQPARTTVTRAFRSGQPDWGRVPDARAASPWAMAVARPPPRPLPQSQKCCGDGLNLPGL
jgi:hypothetical protein